MSDSKLNSKFLGCKVLENGTSDIELGGLLHSIGNKRWTWRKSPSATLGFVHRSFVITFNHHGEKTHVCDLRDVSKVSVHPTRQRVVGFVLNDRQSHTRRFVCFKLCRNANMKGLEFKKLHQMKLQLHHPRPKAKSVRRVQQPREQKTLPPAGARLQGAKPSVPYRTHYSTTTTHSRRHPEKAKSKTLPSCHKYGYYTNGKLVGVAYHPMGGTAPPSKDHTYEPVPVGRSPTYENLFQYLRLTKLHK